MAWEGTPLDLRHFRGEVVTVGDGRGASFGVRSELLPPGRFELLEPVRAGYALRWTPAMAAAVQSVDGRVALGETLAQGERVRLEGGVYRYELSASDRVAVQLGRLTFLARFVAPEAVVKASLRRQVDARFALVLALVLLLFGAVLATALLTPVNPVARPAADAYVRDPGRYAQLVLKQPEKKVDVQRRLELESARAGGRRKDSEGTFGEAGEAAPEAAPSAKGAPRVDPARREKDRQVALASGIFAALRGQADAVSDVLGPGGLGAGIDQALGGLRGATAGSAAGVGGLGSRGAGPGGGGQSLGIGGVGEGAGLGTGGLGNLDLGGRGKGESTVVPGRTVSRGCLSGEVVARVLGRVVSQAKYCYEKELARTPSLEGKVTTRFVIDATGAVETVTITESTLASAEVEACLTRVVQRLRFPPCEGGGIAEVTYPWIFKAGVGAP
jgi:TonB family protein